MITGIVIALSDEINSLTDKKIAKGDCVFINDNTLVYCSGTGPDNAKKASQYLINKGASRLISWGCAAALAPELRPGDLVLADSLCSEQQEQLPLSSSWLQFTHQHLSALTPLLGLLAESSTLVARSEDKKIRYQQSSAIALDMESIAIAKIARQNNLPMLVIRCIADPVTMSLPNAVAHAMNTEGDVALGKLLSHLFLHPSELPNLIKLGLHFNAAKNKLKLVAKQIDIIVGFEQSTEIK